MSERRDRITCTGLQCICVAVAADPERMLLVGAGALCTQGFQLGQILSGKLGVQLSLVLQGGLHYITSLVATLD